MTNQPVWYLENVDVGGIFCPTKLGGGQHLHNTKSFKKGDFIYFSDQKDERIYFINKGRVKVGTYSEDGREITKAILGVGEVFGELILIGEEERRDFSVAMDDTQLCMMTLDEMKSMMRERNGLQAFIMKLIGNRLMKMEKRLEALVFKDSRTRIIEFLKELALEKGRQVGYSIEVRGFLTHQEIANMTATSRQTVTTVLNELRSENLIKFDRKRLLIHELDKLC